MTINFSAGDEPPADLQAFTETTLKEAAEELARVIGEIKAGRFAAIKAAPAAAKELRAVYLLVMDERGRVDKLRKQAAGVVGTGRLDFQAARDEIGRRLARLRDAGPG